MAARIHTGSASKYLSAVVAPGVTATPLSFDFWVLPGTDLTTEQCIVGITNTVNSNGNGWFVEIQTSLIKAQTGVAESYSNSTISGIKPLQWNHVAGVYASSTSRIAYLNGVAGVANTNNLNPTTAGVDTTTIGELRIRSAGSPIVVNPLTGRVCEVRIWSVALDAGQIIQLVNGADPNKIPGLVSRYSPVFESPRQTNAWDYGKRGLVLPMIGAIGAVDDIPSVLRRAPRPDRWDAKSGALSPLTALGALLATGQTASCGLGIGMPDEL